MAENSKIEWCHHTFNPWIGCTKVGPGCDNCYAEADFDKRRHVVQWGAGQSRKRTAPSTWAMPRKWNAIADRRGVRYRVFCASLADVFDNEVPDEWRLDLVDLIQATPHLDWLLLTKRVGNVSKMFHPSVFEEYSNIWIGATITNQAEADRDIPKLLEIPAAVRFLSMEPLLGPVDLTRIMLEEDIGSDFGGWQHCDAIAQWVNALSGEGLSAERTGADLNGTEVSFRTSRLDWVIVGGESGPKARPMSPDWARSLRDQCAVSGVPFLFKQWGEWLPMLGQAEGIPVKQKTETSDGWIVGWAGKKAAGRLLDGVQHDAYPKGGAA